MDYKLTSGTSIIRVGDSAVIPGDRRNADYQDYQAWVTAGGVALPADSTPIPSSLNPRQFRQALTAAGLRATVETAIQSADQNTKDWYGYATSFEREHPILLAMATKLGKKQTDIDNLFILGATL